MGKATLTYFLRVLGLLCSVAGCGQVESLSLPTRPSLSEFEFVQETMRTIGCAESACHRVVVGDFQVSPETPDRAQFNREYLYAKRHIDLTNAVDSPLLTVALSGRDEAFQHPICFADVNDCAYRIILAWITAVGPQDPQPSNLGCMPSPRSCQGTTPPSD
ncbi:MAG: hypothetical protein VX589_10700 [Myxococcota bacterium]|nr:hypothetical protein [Myxococcota bacterium]